MGKINKEYTRINYQDIFKKYNTNNDRINLETLELFTTKRFKHMKDCLYKLLDLSSCERELSKYEFALFCLTSIENDINYMLGELKNGNNKISCQVKGETERA